MKGFSKLITILTTYFTFSGGSFFFATHSTYDGAGYTTESKSSYSISGSLATVTHQCRRRCALETMCQSHKAIPRNVTDDFGVFECRLFFHNGCWWNTTSVQKVPLPGKLWEKLDASQHKAKPCIEYCKVKHLGNCAACRGYNNLNGLDCDLAPKSCADYTSASWAFFPIWPWGFYGLKLNAYCVEQRTTFLAFFVHSTVAHFGYLGMSGWFGRSYTDVSILMTDALKIEWNLISELVAASEKKELAVFTYYSGLQFFFSGLKINPTGELSLNATLNNSQGLPTPLTNVPFVYNNSCGGFCWQFDSNASICNQQNAMLFAGFKWRNVTYTHDNLYFTFS